MKFLKMAMFLVAILGLVNIFGCARKQQYITYPQQYTSPQVSAEAMEINTMNQLWGLVLIRLDDGRKFLIRSKGQTAHQGYEIFLQAFYGGNVQNGLKVQHFLALIPNVYRQEGYANDLEQFFRTLGFECVRQNQVFSKRKGKKVPLYEMEFRFSGNNLPQQNWQGQNYQMPRNLNSSISQPNVSSRQYTLPRAIVLGK